MKMLLARMCLWINENTTITTRKNNQKSNCVKINGSSLLNDG